MAKPETWVGGTEVTLVAEAMAIAVLVAAALAAKKMSGSAAMASAIVVRMAAGMAMVHEVWRAMTVAVLVVAVNVL